MRTIDETTAAARGRGTRICTPAAILGSLAVLASTFPAHADESTPTMSPALRLGDASPAQPTHASPEAAPEGHTVRAGETVSGIAAAYGLRTDDVLRLNGLGWSSIIHPGQHLLLTGGAETAMDTPEPTAEIATPTHTVAAGDTLFAIAQRHGTSVDALLAANGLHRSSIIYPGQTLALSAPMVAASSVAPGGAETAVDAPLDAEQAENARLIIGIGRELGVSDRGIAIALGTAMQESWLRNLDWGDRDSVGLFQQRPSTGWGTPTQILDRRYATLVFFGGAGDPNGHLTRGLLDIPGWESMSFADAAQAVQVSAHPDRYARWEAPAHAWLAALG